MIGSYQPSRSRGFTLLELVVAMAITTVLMAAIYGALHQGLRSWEKINLISNQDQEHYIFRQHLRTQLQTLIKLAIHNERNPDLFFYGDNESIRFVATLSPLQGSAGLYQYQLTTTQDDERPEIQVTVSAYSENQRETEHSPQEQLKLSSNAPLIFSYSDSTSTEIDWLASWPHKKRLPKLIRIAVEENSDPHWPPLIIAVRGHQHVL